MILFVAKHSWVHFLAHPVLYILYITLSYFVADAIIISVQSDYSAYCYTSYDLLQMHSYVFTDRFPKETAISWCPHLYVYSPLPI